MIGYCPTCHQALKRGVEHRCQQTLGQQLARQQAWRRQYTKQRKGRQARIAAALRGSVRSNRTRRGLQVDGGATQNAARRPRAHGGST